MTLFYVSLIMVSIASVLAFFNQWAAVFAGPSKQAIQQKGDDEINRFFDEMHRRKNLDIAVKMKQKELAEAQEMHRRVHAGAKAWGLSVEEYVGRIKCAHLN